MIEHYTDRARLAAGGGGDGDGTSPLFRLAHGIDAGQKEQLLAMMDEMQVCSLLFYNFIIL
jgi:hypothetical protein